MRQQFPGLRPGEGKIGELQLGQFVLETKPVQIDGRIMPGDEHETHAVRWPAQQLGQPIERVTLVQFLQIVQHQDDRSFPAAHHLVQHADVRCVGQLQVAEDIRAEARAQSAQQRSPQPPCTAVGTIQRQPSHRTRAPPLPRPIGNGKGLAGASRSGDQRDLALSRPVQEIGQSGTMNEQLGANRHSCPRVQQVTHWHLTHGRGLTFASTAPGTPCQTLKAHLLREQSTTVCAN